MLYIKIIILIYIFSSIAEYSVHRYIMHNEAVIFDFYKKHRLHHNATNNDMSLNKKFKNYKILGHEENLCLSGWESGLVFGSIIFIITPLCIKLVGEKLNSKNAIIGYIFAFILCLYAKVTWDTIHPYLHHESPLKCGSFFTITGEKIINNFYYKWLMNNHKAHHIFKGNEKGNYNITLPFADFIFGTYNTIKK